MFLMKFELYVFGRAMSSGQETKSIIEDEGLKRVMKYNATNEEYLKVKMDAIRDSRSVC